MSQGNFVWYELSTSDVDGARSFYRDVVGWGTERFPGPEPAYWILKAGERGIGGLMALSEASKAVSASPGWLAYVEVGDTDALLARAATLGATICLPPHDIPTVGRIGVFKDPQGAALAVITPAGSGEPASDGPAPGQVVWCELLAEDAAAELRFYGDLFGWKEIRSLDMGANGAYRIYGKDGRDFGGMMKRPDGYPLPPHWLYYVHVADLDAALERVQRGGGKVWMGPMPIPDGDRGAQCADPQGAVFALHGK